MTIQSDIQKLSPGDIVDMFELDATALGGDVTRYYAGNVAEGVYADLIWQGQTYTAFPFMASGFSLQTQGTLPRPHVRIANVSGLLGAAMLQYDDLVGAKVTRRRTLVKYLDAANFTNGNPSADPNAAWPDEVWFIDRKVIENKVFIEFELVAAWDVTGVLLPRRQCTQNLCSWRYRGEGCGYAGLPVAQADDTPTTDINLDRCGKKISSCVLRFGSTADLPYGGFPGVTVNPQL